MKHPMVAKEPEKKRETGFIKKEKKTRL